MAIEGSAVIKYYGNDGPTYGYNHNLLQINTIFLTNFIILFHIRWFATLVFIVYLILLVLMLLKILIAQLTDVYNSIRQKCEVEAEMNRADVVMRIELDTYYTSMLCKVECNLVIGKSIKG